MQGIQHRYELLLDRMLLGLEKINDLLVNQLKSRPYRWFSSVDFLNFVNNCSLHMTQRTVKFETRPFLGGVSEENCQAKIRSRNDVTLDLMFTYLTT
jgi:hypothetical protein